MALSVQAELQLQANMQEAQTECSAMEESDGYDMETVSDIHGDLAAILNSTDDEYRVTRLNQAKDRGESLSPTSNAERKARLLQLLALTLALFGG